MQGYKNFVIMNLVGDQYMHELGILKHAIKKVNDISEKNEINEINQMLENSKNKKFS